MAEAEDVITDVARHATIYARDLWRRRRTPGAAPAPLALADVAPRLDLLIAAVFGASRPIRAAQPPAPPTFLHRLFRRAERPWRTWAVPATDGAAIYLPPTLDIAAPGVAQAHYRAQALQQAMRAERGSAELLVRIENRVVRDLYLLLEARAADAALVRLLPGMAGALEALRREALARRPALSEFSAAAQALEIRVRRWLGEACSARAPEPPSPAQSLRRARAIAAREMASAPEAPPLLLDWWTGELLMPGREGQAAARLDGAPGADRPADTEMRSARLARRPKVREAQENEDDRQQGAWMVQTAEPHEQAEDPLGMQRPADRDQDTPAEDYADALAELPEARLVASATRPKEVLLSDDPPPGRSKVETNTQAEDRARLQYPEWDYRISAYRHPGATVRLLPPLAGPEAWVERTLAEHRAMLDSVRRRFEMLRAQRLRLRKQLDGEEPDLEAYIDAHADFRAGRPMAQALYQSWRRARRNLAIMLLIDISGSTDGWVSANRRVIDVEREALLLVSIALDGLREPYAIQAFSGEGPQAVTVRPIKEFEDAYGSDIAQRIAALEPESYTRTGAALRHATAVLMRQAAAHRLLLLLSDGKPNDVDRYEGRYGVEDMRQAVTEARLQGIFPFCLTIDRQAANYLPGVFGLHQYAMLPKPELLPAVLLDWMKRLVAM